VDGVEPYRPSKAGAPVDLLLDGNEGAFPPADLLSVPVEQGDDALRRYPSGADLEGRLAGRFGIDRRRVLVTAGGDDALDRACRAVLAPGREMILPVPSFEMLARFAHLAGATTVTVPWEDGPYPIRDVLDRVGPATALIVVVSPNNPTGAWATGSDLRTLAQAAPGALIAVDCAYAEFADEDLTEAALTIPNAVVVRSLSKAWGLAGLRVGYAIGSADVIAWMRAAGLPYSVSRPSLAIATRWLETGADDVAAFVARVREERGRLSVLLDELGGVTRPSQANFVLVRHPRAYWMRDGLAGLGIAVRAFPGHQLLADCVRVTCPGGEDSFSRLERGLRAVLQPQALLFDMDGVLADVSDSYRRAIQMAAGTFGVALDTDEIARAKREPGSNNDWIVTQRLLATHGVEAGLGDVIARFEAAYQGPGGAGGLWTRERPIVSTALLQRLGRRLPLGIVTGRPRGDAMRFLTSHGLQDLFQAVVCLEDIAERKPHPGPVLEALRRLGVERAWMIGDAPDDIRAARAAGVVPLGMAPPGEDARAATTALTAAGAGRVIATVDELEALLP
jgi:histidinol-phosphate aminotransferase